MRIPRAWAGGVSKKHFDKLSPKRQRGREQGAGGAEPLPSARRGAAPGYESNALRGRFDWGTVQAPVSVSPPALGPLLPCLF